MGPTRYEMFIDKSIKQSIETQLPIALEEMLGKPFDSNEFDLVVHPVKKIVKQKKKSPVFFFIFLTKRNTNRVVHLFYVVFKKLFLSMKVLLRRPTLCSNAVATCLRRQFSTCSTST